MPINTWLLTKSHTFSNIYWEIHLAKDDSPSASFKLKLKEALYITLLRPNLNKQSMLLSQSHCNYTFQQVPYFYQFCPRSILLLELNFHIVFSHGIYYISTKIKSFLYFSHLLLYRFKKYSDNFAQYLLHSNFSYVISMYAVRHSFYKLVKVFIVNMQLQNVK